MGVRLIIGTVDGTRHGAAMYDSVSGQMLGLIWEADDAEDQIGAFLEWLRSPAAMAAARPLARTGLRIGRDGTDARDWSDYALAALINHWRSEHVGEDGLLNESSLPA